MDTKTAEIIRKGIRSSTGKTGANAEPLPGMPLGQVPLDFQPTLDAMIKNGEVKIVARPSVTNPNREAKFVAFV